MWKTNVKDLESYQLPSLFYIQVFMLLLKTMEMHISEIFLKRKCINRALSVLVTTFILLQD